MDKNIRIIRTLVGKEIRDILRDKKTLIIMVAVPLLLYPAMIIGMALIMSGMAKSQTEKTYQIAYPIEDQALVDGLQKLYEEKKEDGDLQLQFIPITANRQTSAQDSYAAWMDISRKGTDIQIVVEYNSTIQDSSYAQQGIRDLAESYRNLLLEENLAKKGLTEDFLYPVLYEAKDSATTSESMGMSMGGSIGMLLMVTIMLGAFYPVIDATTGEKERGTLETLLTLPVTNFQMIMSKFIAVALFACAAAILSLLSLGGSIIFLVESLTEGAGPVLTGINAGTLVSWMPVLLLVVLVTALLLTAISMCFCLFAKSFKEANNYITPVMLIVMFASMASMLPSLKLDYQTALIPIVNVSLLVKQVMGQQMDLALAGITIGVNLCFSILVIWLLSRIYNSENVLFKDGFQSFSLFEKRSEIKEGTVPRTGDLLLAITVLLLLIFYLGTAVSVRSALGGTMVNQLLILAVPLVLVWYMKTDWKKLFSLRLPGARNIVGGIFLYLGTFFLSLLSGFLLTRIFPESTEKLDQSFQVLLEAPLFLLILVIAVMPALGEELFFRGLLFCSWNKHLGPVWGILLSSLIFGAFHLSLVKLIPTALLGACFAYITYRSGSILIGMLLHFINNLLSLLSLKYPQQTAEILPVLVKNELPVTDMAVLLLIGMAAAVCGIILLRLPSAK